MSTEYIPNPIPLDKLKSIPFDWSLLNQDNQLNCSFNYQSICKESNISENVTLKRVDFILKKSNIDFLDYCYFFNAHSIYWDSESFVLFILSRINDF